MNKPPLLIIIRTQGSKYRDTEKAYNQQIEFAKEFSISNFKHPFAFQVIPIKTGYDWGNPFECPQFFNAIEIAKQSGSLIFLPDFFWEFIRLSPGQQSNLMSSLQMSEVGIFDFVTMKNICAMDAEALKFFQELFARKRSLSEVRKSHSRDLYLARTMGSKEGRQKAAKKRQENADEFAIGIAKIIKNLKERNDSKLSLAAIANELNKKGLRTRRGRFWTANAEKRVLKRVEKMG